MDQDHSRPFREYVNSLVDIIHQNTNQPTIQANNIELKYIISQMVQSS